MGGRSAPLLLLAAGALAVLAGAVALQDTAGSAWTSPTAAAVRAAWLLSAAVVATATWCVASGRSTAGWTLMAVVALGWAPALAGRSWVPAWADGLLLAAAPLVPLCLLLHAATWTGSSPGSWTARWPGHERTLVAGLALAAGGVTALTYDPGDDPLCTTACGAAGGPWAGAVDARWVVAVTAALTVAAALVGLALVLRRRRLVPAQVVVGVAGGLVVVLVLGGLRATVWGLTPGPPARVLWVLLPAVLAAAGAASYLLSLLSARLRLRAVGARLGSLEDARPGEEVHVARPPDGWVDLQGRPVPPTTGAGLVEVTDAEGRPWARLLGQPGVAVHRLGLADDDAGGWLLLENARQAALLRADEREVEESRRSVVERSDGERRRIERDLHDGVQQRLVSTLLHLAIARAGAPAPALGPLLVAEEETQRALASLREISHGLLPRSLESEGLAPALHELAHRHGMAVELRGPVGALPLPTRTTAYAVVRRLVESAPRPDRSRARVEAGTELSVVVELEGLPRSGTEDTLVEVEDRVGAVGGRLTAVDEGDSLRVEVVLPCAS